MIWTIIPSIALAVLILYGLSQWNSIMKPIESEEDYVLIELYGKQFDWTARYAGEDAKLGRAEYRLIEGLNALGLDTSDVHAADDKIVKGEFHLPVGKPVQFVFRAQDVMHSAYMPHFRAQMNCVPGLKTQFNFVPRKTTLEMKEITGNDEFEFILLCNKICGAAHYNMQMNIIVESQEDYDKWLAEQKEFAQN
jgi:cytochrome c oxidase subunit II